MRFSLNQDYSDRLNKLLEHKPVNLGRRIGRGIEREALRIQPNGYLAKTPHPRQKLGSNLTHPLITTDYSESLLEFITPVSRNHQQLMVSLRDIHSFALKSLGNEALWPMSMPCFVQDEAEIPLARYGTSNIGVMKYLYRQGLKNRYGSPMQIIAGLHYNFSLPDEFWPKWQQLLGDESPLQTFISEQYMGLIRNFYRYGWVIPYWFGASPALCRSFLQGKTDGFDFQTIGQGSLYLPYATSLRMSDLGYTSNAQSSLHISYNSLDEYVQSVRRATQTFSDEFANIGVKVDGEYRQLNANILQIENELYAPIRAKRTASSGQSPSRALHEQGVEYIEVRSLDLNPFVPEGVASNQLQFIDALLLWCLVMPSPSFGEDELQQCRSNLSLIATQGRNPSLKLSIEGQDKLVTTWLEEIMNGMKGISHLLLGDEFVEAIHSVQQHLPLSEQLLSQLLEHNEDNGRLALKLSQTHRKSILDNSLSFWDESTLQEMVQKSIDDQRAIEAADSLSLDDFLNDYFQRASAPLN
ncbi:MAG: Glutamate--cysteine ligase [Candidatus Celerinatantimonas neptuna]|nr:MAG: Glutamate--cysteine ligase [Candidatus Celerinatantimonas neptuna]